MGQYPAVRSPRRRMPRDMTDEILHELRLVEMTLNTPQDTGWRRAIDGVRAVIAAMEQENW